MGSIISNLLRYNVNTTTALYEKWILSDSITKACFNPLDKIKSYSYKAAVLRNRNERCLSFSMESNHLLSTQKVILFQGKGETPLPTSRACHRTMSPCGKNSGWQRLKVGALTSFVLTSVLKALSRRSSWLTNSLITVQRSLGLCDTKGLSGMSMLEVTTVLVKLRPDPQPPRTSTNLKKMSIIPEKKNWKQKQEYF